MPLTHYPPTAVLIVLTLFAKLVSNSVVLAVTVFETLSAAPALTSTSSVIAGADAPAATLVG
jgi:hypothetical protein